VIDNQEKIKNAFKDLSQGLENAIPLKINENFGEWFLEKRDGNPYTIFLLKIHPGKPTKKLNLIKGKTPGTYFTAYPGNPPIEINFSLPAVLYIPQDEAPSIKGKKMLELKI
jgi:hypothetical protein